MSTDLQQFKQFVLDKVATPAGEILLHTIFPNDFELYLVAFEIRDDDDITNPVKEFLIFPVNPDSILHMQRTHASVNKTFNGVHVIDNESFVPTPLNINGTFGRNAKIVFSKKIQIKTGFGVTKILKDLIDKSSMSNDKGNPLRTIFYNLPFGESYTVVVNECRFTESLSDNRVWKYDLNMTAVAPGDINPRITGLLGIDKLFTIWALQKVMNDTFQQAQTLLGFAL